MTHNLLREFEVQALDPPGRDERIAAFSQAVLDMSRAAGFSDVLNTVEARRFEAASYGANLLLRGVQKQLLRSDPEYPYEYDEPKVWSGALGQLLDSSSRSSELAEDLSRKNTQSNVAERYKAFKLTIELVSPWVPQAPRLLDVGCSRNHGLKKLHLNLPFKPIACGIESSAGVLSSRTADRLFNAAVASPKSYGASVGVDITPLDPAENSEWAKSCSFYPSELLDKTAVEEYDYLEHVEPAGVNFRQEDILDPHLGDEHDYDVITVSTFLYQLSPAQRSLARGALKQKASDEGLIIYQDFIKRDRSGTEMQYEDSWFATLYPYRTLVEAPSRSDDRLYEVFRWSGGRCKEWIPGRDLDELIQRTDVV